MNKPHARSAAQMLHNKCAFTYRLMEYFLSAAVCHGVRIKRVSAAHLRQLGKARYARYGGKFIDRHRVVYKSRYARAPRNRVGNGAAYVRYMGVDSLRIDILEHVRRYAVCTRSARRNHAAARHDACKARHVKIVTCKDLVNTLGAKIELIHHP